MPAAGNYQLYVQAQKFDNGTYSPSAPTSAVFDLPVENMTYYSFSVNSSDGDNYIDLGPNGGGTSNRVLLASTETDVYLKLYGETDSMISEVFSGLHDFLNNSFSNKPYYFSIDTSELVSTSDEIFTNNVLQDLEMLKSIVMPDCSKTYSTAIFKNCSNLEYVKFGEDTEVLNNCWAISDGGLFDGCSSLSKVEFEKPQNWYNSETSIVDINSINWSTLELIDVSDPEANATHIKNDDWGYLYRKTE